MRLASIAIFAAAATAAAAGCAAETDERPAEFAYIAKAILEPSCATATCHDASTQREGLDFSSVEASTESLRSANFVTNFDDPPNNRIIYTLRGVDGQGERFEPFMPVDGPLPDADIELIQAWIAAGAQY